MYLSGFNQPNFTSTGDGRGFVSIYRTDGHHRCTALWIIYAVERLMREGNASELLEMNGGLSNEFHEGGRNSSYLTGDVLEQLKGLLGTYDTPQRLSLSQAHDLAELAVAVLNYDANHTSDDTPVLCAANEREIVIEMIKLVDEATHQSTLLDDLLEPDIQKLSTKSINRHIFTRP